MHIVCPHCRNPIEVVGPGGTEPILCPSCGSTFQLEPGTTVGPGPGGRTRLGRFELLHPVGAGTFGTVYRARDPGLDRVVAIKVPRAGNLVGADLDRFLREARSVAQLRHPSIVPVHEVGQEGGLPYLVSDFVEGVTLADVLTARRPPPGESAGLVAAVAEALQYAHERGVVHRDVKPSNILLGEDGTPHVMDFGLAKRDAGEITMTLEGQVLGTPAYMSPEQARGEGHRVDGRSDVYSLGVILYQMLTGELPFRGNTRMLLHQVLHDEPRPPRSLNDRVPRDLETVCLKALAKEPARRYASAGALAADLRRFLKGEAILARPVGRAEKLARWCRRNPVVAGLGGALAVALLGGLAGVTWQWRLAAANYAEARDQRAQAVEQQRLAEERGEENRRQLVRLQVANGARLLDDGDLTGALLWFAEALRLDQGDPPREAVHRIRLGAILAQCPRLAQVWAPGGEVVVPRFSADGRHVTAVGGPRAAGGVAPVHVWDAETGRPISPALKEGPAAWPPAVDFCGGRVVTVGAGGAARVWDLGTGEPVTPPVRHAGPVTAVAFSPDGRRVVSAARDGTARVWDAATGKAVAPELRPGAPVRSAVFTDDGRRVVTAAGTTVRLWDAATGAPLSRALRDVEGDSGFPTLSRAFSPDGRRALTYARDGAAVVVDTATGRPALPPLQLPSSAAVQGRVSAGEFSPDGTRIVTVSPDARAAQLWDAATGRAAGPPLRHPSYVHDADFSPDGRYVVTASVDQTARLWDAATGPPLRHPDIVYLAAFSPDGDRILTHGNDGRVRVWDVFPGRSPARVLPSQGQTVGAAFSPNGRRVVTASADGTARVWEAATGRPVTSALRHDGPVTAAAFSPDGRRVLTVTPTAARSWDARTGEPLGTALDLGSGVRRGVFSPDGRWLLVLRDSEARVWDVARGEPVSAPVRRSPGGGEDAAFSPDGRRVITFRNQLVTRRGEPTWEGEADVWEAATGRLVCPALRPGPDILGVAFSPDGRLLATGCRDYTAHVWDAATGRPVGRPLRHSAGVFAVAFSPDGRSVVTGATDKTARVWDALTGEPRTAPLRHTCYVQRAAFSPDGRWVVTAAGLPDDPHGETRVWDAATGDPVAPPLGGNAWSVNWATFSPDSRRVVYGSGGVAALWDLAPDERPAEDLQALARLLTGHKLHATGDLVPEEPDALQRAWGDWCQRYPPGAGPAAEERLAWHRQLAEACEARQCWFAAAWHLTRLLERGEPGAAPWSRRAGAYFYLGRLDEAAADYERALRQEPGRWQDRSGLGQVEASRGHKEAAALSLAAAIAHGADDPRTWYYLALLQADAGDAEAYRKTCAGLLERFGKATEPETVYFVALTCAVREGAAADLRGLADAMRKVAAARKDSRHLVGLGHLLYRTGDAEGAVKVLKQGLEAQKDGGDPWQWLVLALAEDRLGHKEQARAWLEKSAAWLDGSAGRNRSWNDRLHLELLRREAAERLGEAGRAPARPAEAGK
jgi:WD40 repeat protein/tetratricopeptide (TPR) repeat protein